MYCVSHETPVTHPYRGIAGTDACFADSLSVSILATATPAYLARMRGHALVFCRTPTTYTKTNPLLAAPLYGTEGPTHGALTRVRWGVSSGAHKPWPACHRWLSYAPRAIDHMETPHRGIGITRRTWSTGVVAAPWVGSIGSERLWRAVVPCDCWGVG